MRETPVKPNPRKARTDNVPNDGTVVNGMRTIELVKDEPKHDNPRLARYKAMGYTIKDDDYRYLMSIPQSEFEKREKERAAISHARMNPKKDKTMLRDDIGFESLTTPEKFLAALDTATGASEFGGEE